MKKITDFLGKPVISLFEGNIEGYVKNIVFDKKLAKVKYLIIFEDNEFQDEKMLEINKIFKIGDNAIVIKNNSCLELLKPEVLPITNHINCKIYSTTGNYIGIISDIEIDDNYSTKDIILTNETTINPKNILTFGQDIFIAQEPNNIIKINSIRKRKQIVPLSHNVNINKVNIMPTYTNNENTSLIENNAININNEIQQDFENENISNKKKYEFNNSSIPKKLVVNNSDFLIGRKTTKTIYTSNNEIVVRKNVIINQKIIQQAIIYNKLRELSIYSI